MPPTAEIFGEQALPFVRTIRQLAPKLKGSVPDYYQPVMDALRESSEVEWHYCYWNEIFGRAYIAAATSLIRHEQWITGVEACYQAHSYLGLCASIRGLLESTADSMHTLQCFAPTVAKYWSQLRTIFAREPIQHRLEHKELEDLLIHFAYARHVGKGEQVPDGHKALTNRAYIDTIRNADPNLEKMYCELVELVHPAKDSIQWMLLTEGQDTHLRLRLNSGAEAASAICNLLDTYRDALYGLTVLSCNYSLLTLKCLREMRLRHMDLAFMDEINLSRMPAWKQFQATIRSSSKSSSQG
jgi:hypothetical protein